MSKTEDKMVWNGMVENVRSVFGGPLIDPPPVLKPEPNRHQRRAEAARRRKKTK